MWLPRKLYEALPALYIALGALFLAGSLYVGIDHWLMIGYVTIGSVCVLLGIAVVAIRKRARNRTQPRNTRAEELFV